MADYRTDLILIASADDNWGIGFRNGLLMRIPEDMKRFSELTRGNMIIVGRKTLESFKDSKPLPGRVNVVLTKDRSYKCEGATIVHDLEGLMDAARNFPGKVYVCGGESVYRLLLPYCSTALITRIKGAFTADTRLPNLDESGEWYVSEEGDWQESKNGSRFRYVTYLRHDLR
jgi:dihydrofolate reductase